MTLTLFLNLCFTLELNLRLDLDLKLDFMYYSFMQVINSKNPAATPIIGPAVAVDAVLFAIVEKKLSVLMVKISEGVYKNNWALPGGLVQLNESCEEASTRVLWQKTSIKGVHMEQLYTFCDPKRDKRGRSVSVAYFALISDPQNYNLKKTKYYSDVSWYPVSNLPLKIAFDHKQIIEKAHKRLKAKMEYTNIAYSLLPKKFTLTQLQKLYETVWGKKLDKRNFRKKMLAGELLAETGGTTEGATHRPARFYSFNSSKIVYF